MYRISVVDESGGDERTLYEGTSYLQSQKVVEIARTALVIGRGTATIKQYVGELPGPSIEVREGTWSWAA